MTVTRGAGSGGVTFSLSHSAAGGGYDAVPVPGVRVVLLQSRAEIEALEQSLAVTGRMLLNSVTGVFDGRRRALERPFSEIENESLANKAGAQLYGLARMLSGSRRTGMPYAQSFGSMFGAGPAFGLGHSQGYGQGFGQTRAPGFGLSPNFAQGAAGFGPGGGIGFAAAPGFGAGSPDSSAAMPTSGPMNAAGPISAPVSHGPSLGGMGGMTPGPMPTGGAMPGPGAMPGAGMGAGTGGGMDWESQLWGRSFVVPLGLADDESALVGPPVRWTLWGASDLQTVSGAPDGGRYDGDMRSVYFGADREINPNWLAGIAISRAIGNVNYHLTGADGVAAGSLGTRLTNLYPYVIGRLSEDLDVWALGGLGRGDADVNGERPEQWESSDLGMSLAAGGFRLGMAEYGIVRLAMIGDAGFASLSTDGGVALDGLQATTRRLRLGVEGEVDLVTMRPYWQLSARNDGGDGQTGTGLDLVAGVRYTAPRVSFEAQGRWLLLHSATGYGEFSATASLAVSANTDGSGFMLKLAPSWGQGAGGAAGMGGSGGMSGAMQLWSDRSLTMSPVSGQSPQLSLTSEFGYGFLMRRGILTPLLSVSRNGTPGQIYSLGVGYASLRELTKRQLNLQFTYGHDSGRPQDRVYGFRLIYLF